MNKRPNQTIGIRASYFALSVLAIFSAGSVGAAEMEQARVTRAINDVKILPANASPRKARPGNVISGTTAVGTGDRSRAELEFSDQSLVRLGSNSVFAFKSSDRELELKKGSLLLQVPKGHGKTKIKSLPITAAITGTTILFECSGQVLDAKGREKKPGIVKLIVMEGSLEWGFNAKPGKKLKMGAGDMVVFPTNARRFPKKVKVDLGRIKDTSLLMDGGMGELPDMTEVNLEIAKQKGLGHDVNHPANGFPVKAPKPDLLERGVRAGPPDSVKIPPRPER